MVKNYLPRVLRSVQRLSFLRKWLFFYKIAAYKAGIFFILFKASLFTTRKPALENKRPNKNVPLPRAIIAK